MRNPVAHLLLVCVLAFDVCAVRSVAGEPPGGRRELNLDLNGHWIGRGVCFSPYRDGESPTGRLPSDEEILVDLQLVAPYWQLLLTYDANPVAERTLALIRQHHLPLRLLLGAWISAPIGEGSRAANQQQTDTAIRLANAYPDIVLAVVVGNETCVDWSDHRMKPADLIPWIRRVRTAIKQPVTTADDFNFWNKPESNAVAAEIDFINLHAYPLWNGRQVEEAMAWAGGVYDDICRQHPGLPVIYGEIGWATQHDATNTRPGSEGTLMKGEVSVRAQEVYLRQHYDWIKQRQVPVVLFEAFDENWKGGGDSTPATVAEKHWGVFTADRKPKVSFAAIIRDYYSPAPDQSSGR